MESPQEAQQQKLAALDQLRLQLKKKENTMKLANILTITLICGGISCTKKLTGELQVPEKPATENLPEATPSSPDPKLALQAPMDATHSGALTPDPVTGEVREAYKLSPEETLKLNAFAVESEKYLAANKDLSAGKKVFATYCAVCHGPEGKGGGPGGDALAVAPTNFHEWPIKYGRSPAELALTITVGRNEQAMPSFDGKLKKDELWAVVALVSSWLEARPDHEKAN